MPTKLFTRSAVAVVSAAALSVSLAACGNDNGGEGGSAPAAVAALDEVPGGTTAVKLDKGFTDALSSLKLTPGVLGKAKLKKGSLIFPITGGNVTVFKPGEVSPYVIGQLQHVDSGLSLSAGGTTVQLSALNVDPGVSRIYGDVSVNGKLAVRSAYLFTLDGRTLKPLETKGNKAILQGTKVKISPVAAGLLNETFSTDAVTKDLLVGVATIKVKTK